MWLRLHFYAGAPGIAKATKGVISLFISSSGKLFLWGAQRSERRVFFAMVGAHSSSLSIFFVGWTTLFFVSHSNEYQHSRTCR
jgi:hypothetical protein